MLPERLTFALSCLSLLLSVYLSLTHGWSWDETMVAVLFGVFASTLIGRIAGSLSARELARALGEQETQAKNGGAAGGQQG